MTATLATSFLVPFDFYSFYEAVIERIGRCAIRIIWRGQEGYCELVFKPRSPTHESIMAESISAIEKLVDVYDVISPETSVQFVADDPVLGAHLHILVRHPARSKIKAAAV
jgi:hypothetical protein